MVGVFRVQVVGRFGAPHNVRNNAAITNANATLPRMIWRMDAMEFFGVSDAHLMVVAGVMSRFFCRLCISKK